MYTPTIYLDRTDKHEDCYIVEVSSHLMNDYPDLLLIVFPDGSSTVATAIRVVGAIVYEVDGNEILHIIND